MSELSRWVADVIVTWRRLARDRGFSCSAILLLSVGLGVGVSFFSAVNAAFFKHRKETLHYVRFCYKGSTDSQWSTFPESVIDRIIGNPPESLTRLFGHGSAGRVSVTLRGGPTLARVDSISGPYFEMLGASPLVGRLLSRGDEDNVVISEAFWRGHLGSDPSIVGTPIIVAGRSLIVIGIVSRSFQGLGSNVVATDLWVDRRVLPVRQLFGQLTDGVSLKQASAEVGVRYSGLQQSASEGVELRSGLTPALPPSALAIVLSALAIGLSVTFVTGVSLTLLLLARVAGSRGNIAVRLALGATARDIVRLLTVEVALIISIASVIGTSIATVLARVSAQATLSLVGLGTLALDPSPDWRVYLYVCAGTLALGSWITAVLATHAVGIDALAVTTSAAGGTTTTERGASRRRKLIVAQVGTVAVLLYIAALFLRSAVASLTFDTGFEKANVAVGWIDQTPFVNDSDRISPNFHVLQAVLDTPGVLSAALVTRLPGNTPGVSTKARSATNDVLHWVLVQSSTSAFFKTIGLPIARGRSFTSAEELSKASVVVVSQSVADTFWPGEEPLEKELWFAAEGDVMHSFHVIGVVSDARVDSGDISRRRDVFLPFGYRAEPAAAVIVRTLGPSVSGVQNLRRLQSTPRARVGFLSVRTLDQELATDAASSSIMAAFFAALGGVGLFTATAGLYGIAAQLAIQRRREISIRKALGATNSTICRMLAQEGAATLVLGIGPGLSFGLLTGYVLQPTFPMLHPLDWLSFVFVAATLLATGLAGAILPFRKVLTHAYAPLREL